MNKPESWEEKINIQFPIMGKVAMEENKNYEEVIRANFHRRQGALWLLENFNIHSLLKQQREICAETYLGADLTESTYNQILNAPEPSKKESE